MTWELLSADGRNPSPGDVEALRRLSRSLRATSDDALEIKGRLRATSSAGLAGVWEGPAATAWLSAVETIPPDLGRIAASFRAASRAVSAYASTVAELQRQSVSLLDNARQKYSELRNAQAELWALDDQAPDFSQQAAVIQQRIDSLVWRRDALRTEAESVRGQHRDAARRLQRLMIEASDLGIKNRGLLERIMDGTQQFLEGLGETWEEWQPFILIGAAIAVAVLSGPIGLGTAFAAVNSGLFALETTMLGVRLFECAISGEFDSGVMFDALVTVAPLGAESLLYARKSGALTTARRLISRYGAAGVHEAVVGSSRAIKSYVVVYEVADRASKLKDYHDRASSIWRNRSEIIDRIPTPIAQPTTVNTWQIPFRLGN